MQIYVLSVGKIKESYLREAIAEYQRRIQGFCTLELREIPEHRAIDPSPEEIQIAIHAEGDSLLRIAPQSSYLVALDPRGKERTSENFASLIHQWEIEGPYTVSFLIGGPFGLSDHLLAKVGLPLSLSPMTFPHQMVRMILLEQIYRAFTINKGIPYHK